VERETAAARAAVQAWEARQAAGSRRGRRPVAPEDSARVRRAAAWLERAEARQATRQAAAGREPARRNVTDPASRLMPVRGGGFIQGYNAQNVTSEDGLVIATRLTSDTTDTRWWEPMMKAAAADRKSV